MRQILKAASHYQGLSTKVVAIIEGKLGPSKLLYYEIDSRSPSGGGGGVLYNHDPAFVVVRGPNPREVTEGFVSFNWASRVAQGSLC